MILMSMYLTHPGHEPIVYLFDRNGGAVRYVRFNDFRWQNPEHRKRLWPTVIHTGAFEVTESQHQAVKSMADGTMELTVLAVAQRLLGDDPELVTPTPQNGSREQI